jgi:hypothetical protein
MSKVNKSKTLSLDEIKNIIIRDINLGSDQDNLSDTTIKLYTRQLIKLYKAGIAKEQWSPNEFIIQSDHEFMVGSQSRIA